MQTTGANPMRLQKFLAHAGICSRRKAESHIIDGRVMVNDIIITELGTQVDPVKDKVSFDNSLVEMPKADQGLIYIAVNKPRGVVTTCSQKNVKIILDLVPVKERIYPVGRLDKDSIGLVLLTNDGDLHNRLSHPSHDHEKEYLVTTVHSIGNGPLKAMAAGMVIEGEKTREARVKRVSKNGFKIILKQGRNRQIRKMVTKVGNKVDMLKRVRMANINLGNLKEGKWRYLTTQEMKTLTQ